MRGSCRRIVYLWLGVEPKHVHTLGSSFISCFATCHNLGDVLENYVILDQREYLPPCAKSEVSVLSYAVFVLGLSCLCHRLLGRFSFMAQSYLVFLVEVFGVQWKG